MKHVTLTDISAEQAAHPSPYLEFMREDSMSLGLYVLPAGSQDKQSPHTEDEVYIVESGRAMFKSGDKDIAVAAGSILFVPAGEAHHFHDITEELQLIVFFAPPEYNAAECPE